MIKMSSPGFEDEFEKLQDALDLALDEKYPSDGLRIHVDLDVDKARGVITVDVLDFMAPGNIPSPAQIEFVMDYLAEHFNFPFEDVSKKAAPAAALTPVGSG